MRNLGEHNRFLITQLAKTFNALLIVLSRRCRHSHLTGERAIEMKVSRHVAERNMMERLAVAASLMVPGGSLQDIMEFHQILKHQGEAIERHRALMAGVQRKGAWIPCVIDARARAR